MNPEDNETDHYVWNKALEKAIAKWKGIEIDSVTSDHCRQLAILLNDYDPKRGRFIVDITKPHIRDLISKINGPYGDVILKMLTIKMEHKENGYDQHSGI